MQRLVGQALGSSATRDASRVRPATSVHAQVPLGATPEIEPAPGVGPRIPRVVDSAPSDDHQHSVTATREVTHPTVMTREIVARMAQDSPRAATMRAVADKSYPAPDTLERQVRDPGERAPTPLLREESSVAPPTVAVMPLPTVHPAREAARNQAAAEATEVHVHIGRIEVIAAPEAKKPEKKPRTPRSTVPLGDYLARRRPT